jgi:UDP-N-acetyl-D-mannosaminuronate dehydrogenase
VSDTKTVVVVGLGEVGKPLLELVSAHHNAIGIDLTPVQLSEPADVLHVCYPFEIKDFIGETTRYIELLKPALTVINSTVAIGTTRAIAERTGAPVVNSPVRGKHARMLKEMRTYTKFVGALNADTGQQAAAHFESLGLTVRVLSSPEASELAKLSETTYFGLMIAWAQEIERYCDLTGADYHEVVSFYEEIKFFPPVKYFPGIIGGHCVMPNIEILSRCERSAILDAIRISNRMKITRESRAESSHLPAQENREPLVSA